jgi:hypothetical protein
VTTAPKNEGLWLAGIPELLPVSFKASLDAVYDPSQKNKVDLATRSLQLQAGGAFREAAGFFVVYNAYTEGKVSGNTSNIPPNNNSDIQELFFQWRHGFGTPVNLKVGRFEPNLTLWKTSDRLTIADLATQVYRVGGSTGDKPFTVGEAQDAIELNSLIGSRLFVAGGVVNRKDQESKEGYGHLSFRLGGTDFLGHEPQVDLENDSVWDYLSLTLGAYGYVGRNELRNSTQPGNDFYRAGIDADLLYKRLRLKVSGVKGGDNNPNYASPRNTGNSLVLTGEAQYQIGSPVNLIGVFRYEYEDNASGIIRRYIPALVYAPIQNVKLTLEYQHKDNPAFVDTEGKFVPAATDRIGLLGASFSF